MSIDDLTIIITTFHSHDKIYKCLDSIDKRVKVIIIENSEDKIFKENIEKRFKNVECVLSGENLGYAKGNNLGLSKVKSQYVLILNPDALLEKNTINNFLKFADNEKNFAIVGPMKQEESKNLFKNLKKQKFFEVQFLKGFAMFLNLKQFSNVGYFDGNFFIYLEEIDLCKRIIENNRKIYLHEDIKIDHIGGSSHDESINFEMELSRNWHWMWSTFYFNKKHFGYHNALIKVSRKFISSIFKMVLYTLTFNRKKRKIYFQRFSGLLNSILGRKSWYRPKIIKN